MTDEFVSQKNKIHSALYPMIQLLEYKRKTLEVDLWQQFVRMTKESIVNNPDQYLGQEPIDRNIIQKAIDEIFDEIVEQDHVGVLSI